MTAYKPGDILLIPFPFTDLSTFKQRPCLVISSAEFNSSHEDIIVAAITSQIPEQFDSAEYLLKENELRVSGLPKASIIKLGKIVTLDKRLIRKVLGSLPRESVKQISGKICELFNNN